MSLQRIDEIEGEPIIGREYLVPCVERRCVWGDEWMPVIGAVHDDAEYIGVTKKHWHFDWRFCDQPSVESSDLARILYSDRAVSDRVKWIQLKCLRSMPEFPLQYTDYSGTTHQSTFAAKLEAGYANVKMKCMICPHRGLPLSGLPVKDGTVVCPGHGLKWRLADGAMVPRVAQ